MTLRGAVRAFPLETVLQLLAATQKTGELEVRSEAGSGALGISGGRLVSARWDEEIGEPALGAAFAAREGVFSFEPAAEAPRPNLSGDLDQLLDRAVEQRDKLLADRQLVPDERTRFRLSERAAAQGEIKLSAEEWRALLAVDGERDVAAIAERLGMRRLPARGLLADLVRAGLVDTLEPAPGTPQEPRFTPRPHATDTRLRTRTGDVSLLKGSTEGFALDSIVQLLAATEQNGRLEVWSDTGSGALGMSTGRLVSAVWDDDEAEGEFALGAAFAASGGKFAFVDRDLPPVNLRGELDELLDRGAQLRDRLIEVRAVIPDRRMPFRLSARAAQRAEIRLTSAQWRALLAVNGQRDAQAIATQLRLRHLETLLLLADLVREGLVEAAPELTWPAIDRRHGAPWPSAAAAPGAAFVRTETVAPELPIEPAETEAAEAVAVVPPYVAPAEPALAALAVEAPPVVVPEEVPSAIEPAPEISTAAEVAPEPEVAPELEVAPEPGDRLAALAGIFGPAQAAPSPTAWEPPVTEVPGPTETPAATETPAPAEVPAPSEAAAASPAWEAPMWEQPAKTWEQPATTWEQPSTTWEPPAPVEPAPAPSAWDLAAPVEPVARAEPATEPAEADPRLAAFGVTPTEVTLEPAPELAPPAAAEMVAPPVEIKKEKKRGFPFFGRKEAAAAVVAPAAIAARGRAAQLASFSNELLAEYGTGRYGKARLDQRMLGRLMRVDEQADPIDRPMPVTGDRLDVRALESELVPERQSVPYLAILVRQIYEDAEKAYGRDKARRGYREARQRVFGKDLSALQSPDLVGRLPRA